MAKTISKQNASVNDEDVLHEVRVKLYPNNLPTVEGKYIARTYNRRKLNIENVCKVLKRRTKFEGDYNEMVKMANAFLDEVVYQLCDGHSVNLGYFSLYLNIGGSFESMRDRYDREKNPLSYRIRTLAKLNRTKEFINIEVEGLADTDGFIETFFDAYTESSNKYISGGDLFSITGEKIKVQSDGINTDCGIYFVDTKDPSIRIKVKSYLIENSSTKLAGNTPMLIAPAAYRVEVVTQFTGSGTLLKKPRTISSNFELTVKH